jgi:hypothetical protein
LKEPLKIFVLIDFQAATETYTADESKMSIFPQQKAISMLWYWETKSVNQAQRRYRLKYGEEAHGRQSVKRLFERLQETGKVCIRRRKQAFRGR